MGIIVWILLGLISGWAASVLMKTNTQQGTLGDILLGIAGALVGGFLFSLFGGEGITGLNLYSIFVAVLGAVFLIGLRRAVVT